MSNFTWKSKRPTSHPFSKPPEGVWIGEYKDFNGAAQKQEEIRKHMFDEFHRARTVNFHFHHNNDGSYILYVRAHEKDVLDFLRKNYGSASDLNNT